MELESLSLVELIKLLAGSKPHPDEVAILAYQIYVEEGFHDGCDNLHWQEAEEILWCEKILHKIEQMRTS